MNEDHVEAVRRFPKPPPAIYAKLSDDIKLELDALEAAWERAEAIPGQLIAQPLELVRIQIEELLRRGCELDVLNIGDLRALHALDTRKKAEKTASELTIAPEALREPPPQEIAPPKAQEASPSKAGLFD